MTEPSAPGAAASYSKDYWDLVMDQLRRRPSVRISLTLLALLYATAIYAPFLAGDRPLLLRATDAAAPGVLMGTPSYISPEMASGGSPTTRSDVFALGVILYEILTGRKPFTRDTPAATLEAVRTFQPLEPRRGTRHVPRELSAICMKAIARDPEARYPTARELAADLRDYRNFLPISAVTPTLRERAVKWARRHPRTMAAIGTFVAALLIFGSIRAYRVAAERAAVEQFWTQYQDAAADIDRLGRSCRNR